MNEIFKVKFAEFNDMSKKELDEIREDLIEELNYCEKILNDKESSSSKISETYGDIKYAREKLEYIDYLLSNRKSKSH